MAGWHQTIIIGHVGRNAESKEVGESLVCNFSVAVSEKWGGEDHTTWYRVAAWNKLAEICERYVVKGMQIMVTGNIATRAWIGKDGEAHSSLELRARDVKFLSGVQRDDDEQQRYKNTRDIDDNNGADIIPF